METWCKVGTKWCSMVRAQLVKDTSPTPRALTRRQTAPVVVCICVGVNSDGRAGIKSEQEALVGQNPVMRTGREPKKLLNPLLASTWDDPEEVTSIGDFSLFTQMFTLGCLSLCCQWTSPHPLFISRQIWQQQGTQSVSLVSTPPPTCLCSVPSLS